MHFDMRDNSSSIFFKVVKWGFKTMLLIFGIIPQSGCSSGYKENKGKIILDGKEITNKNLIVLSDEFAKDSSVVYYKGRAFEYADAGSFEALDAHYAKDKNKAYYCDEYREGKNYYLTKKQTILEVELAISSSFVSVGDGYAKDSKHAFFTGKVFSVKDKTSFKVLNSNFCKDDIQAYLNCKPVTGSDGKSFELLNEFFARDKNHVYLCQSAGPQKQLVTILRCDAASFRLLEYPYSKDTARVFYEGKSIAGADAASFKVLGNGYSKDFDAVYFETRRLIDADAATFELFKDNKVDLAEFNYAKDKSSIFIEGKKITGADVGSFKILTLGYGADIKYVFYKHVLVKGARVASFKTYADGNGDEDAEDLGNKYLKGEKIFR